VLCGLCDGGFGGAVDEDRGGSLKGRKGVGWTVGDQGPGRSVGGEEPADDGVGEVFLPGVREWLWGEGGNFKCWCGTEGARGDRESGDGLAQGGVTSAAALRGGGCDGVCGGEGRMRRREQARAVFGILCGGE
jgi:hypothetical protein